MIGMIGPLHARNVSAVSACVIILLGAVGCGRPTMAKVWGTVTSQGRPVPYAIVEFIPTKGPGGGGLTDAEGRFSLTTLKPGDGAFFGLFRVTVTPFVLGNSDNPPPPPKRPDIPDRYRTVDKTPLTAEVVAGKKNVIDFKLD